MEIKLVKSSIVILASSHNPSIITPQWLKKQKIINEKPINFVNTNEFTFINYKDFSITVDLRRVMLSAIKYNIETIELLEFIGKKYINLLPHNPYEALGLNFGWQVKSFGTREVKINIQINTINNISSTLKGHEINYGCIIYARKTPYLLKLTIDPTSENIYFNNFNYHHKIKDIDIDIVIKYINNFRNLYIHSQKFIKDMYLKKEGQQNDI